MKVVSYRHQGKHGVGVVSGANGLIALANAAPDLPNDLRRILEIDPALSRVRAAAAGKSADLSLDEIAFDPVIREPHATWALALNYKLHIEETGLTTSPTYPQIFLRMPICQVGHREPLWAPNKKIAEAYDYEGELAVIIGKPAASSSVTRRSRMSPATPATTKARCASTRATTASSGSARTSSSRAASARGW